jgi:hypothetical protein
MSHKWLSPFDTLGTIREYRSDKAEYLHDIETYHADNREYILDLDRKILYHGMNMIINSVLLWASIVWCVYFIVRAIVIFHK